jgi:predicted ATPase
MPLRNPRSNEKAGTIHRATERRQIAVASLRLWPSPFSVGSQIASIVNGLTNGKILPTELLGIIATKTDGVPLFVEEITKTVLESGELRETASAYQLTGPLNRLTILSTLYDSLMAWLDRLQPVKEVAQTAACIGRDFDYGLLKAASPLDDAALQDALERLTDAELIFSRGAPPDSTYLRCDTG